MRTEGIQISFYCVIKFIFFYFCFSCIMKIIKKMWNNVVLQGRCAEDNKLIYAQCYSNLHHKGSAEKEVKC